MTSTRASDSSSAQRSESRSIASSSSLVTFFMRMRLEWKVKFAPFASPYRRKITGTSVSIVVFELGTICPIRKARLFISRYLPLPSIDLYVEYLTPVSHPVNTGEQHPDLAQPTHSKARSRKYPHPHNLDSTPKSE